MDNAARQALIERYLAAYNAFDVAGMMALLSEDVRFENHSGGELTVATDGRDAFQRLAEQSCALFSQREQQPAAWRFDADRAVVDIDYRGTLTQDIPGGPAAGSELALRGRSEFGFSGDRIAFIADHA